MSSTNTSPPFADRPAALKKAIALTLLCAVVAALSSSDRLHTSLTGLMTASEHWIQFHEVLGAFLFIGLAALSAMVAFVSVVLIIPVAVYTWGPIISLLLLWVGWILGGLLAYSISRFFGRRIVHWFTAEQSLNRLEYYINGKTPFSLVLLFQLALPSEIPGYLLGLVRYPLKYYLAALALAELPYTAASVLLGDSFLNKQSYTLLSIGLVMIAFSFYVLVQLRKRIEKERSSTND